MAKTPLNTMEHIWNKLPNNTKSTKIKHFKSLLKAWDGTKCQCSMCEAWSLKMNAHVYHVNPFKF